MEAGSLQEEAPAITDTIVAARELDHFPREDVDGAASDLVLELHIASPIISGSLLETSSPSLLPPLPPLPSPVVDEGDSEDTLKTGEGIYCVLKLMRNYQKVECNWMSI